MGGGIAGLDEVDAEEVGNSGSGDGGATAWGEQPGETTKRRVP
jgi:cephalosporin-C deacetylase-like acetyl esterase